MMRVTESGLLYAVIVEGSAKRNTEGNTKGSTKDNKKIYAITPYYTNDVIINSSFKESLTIPHLLQMNALISIENKFMIDMNHAYSIFCHDSIFIAKHVPSLIASIKKYDNYALVGIPNLLIDSRIENPNCPCNLFPKKQLVPHNEKDTHFIGIYYDEIYNVMKLHSGQINENNLARKWVFTFTLQKDEWNYVNFAPIIYNFLFKTFPEIIITDTCFEPTDIWVDAHDRICALLKMTLMRKVIYVSYDAIKAELNIIKEKKEKILAAQAIESRKDETIPENLPNLTHAQQNQ